LVKAGETALVVLDSAHSKDHVAQELEAYHGLVTPGSYLVATDGIMHEVADTPHGRPGWRSDNPATAAAAFLKRHAEFVLEVPPWPFNESSLTAPVTHWPGAWLRRR
jgi:cephalosporin hydroxylase